MAAISYFSAILEVVKMSNCVKHYTMIVFQTFTTGDLQDGS